MPTLSLNVDMQGKLAVVVGGGAVALRKVLALLAAGAAVRVVAPHMVPELAALEERGELSLRRASYSASDLDGAFLAVAAANKAAVNQQVAADAGERGILVAVADRPASGNCRFPALLRRGELEIAVSTGGRCPALAVAVRDVIAGVIGDEYGVILDRLVLEREKLLTDSSSSTYNGQVLRSRAAQLISELTERKDTA